MRVHVRARHERVIRIVREHGSLSIADVAAELGVSMVTVRRDAGLLVSEGRLGRVHGSLVWPGSGRPAPTPAAAAAPVGEGTVVGMIVPTMGYSFSEIVQGAREVLDQRGARLVLSLSGYLIEEDRTQVERLVAAGANGLLLTPSWEEGSPGAGEEDPVLAAASVPTVLVERWTRPGSPAHDLDRVRSDSAFGAGAAVRHLAALGHRHLALSLQSSPHAQQLRAGFEDALATLGLPEAPALQADPGRSVPESERYDLTLEFLRQGVREQGITAAFVHSDADAVVLVPRLQALGIRVPEDLALVVYDDEVAGLSELPLTAVAPPKRAVGAQAARLLLERLEGEPDRPRQHVELLPQLRVRDSSGDGRARI
ncbi:substrate-binding domain-containing protein [Streptomyces sp. NPDC059979]|uniref:LacI family DNA-binding transcriptional regulator n=1 Tax=Streptomyces sp. NPDC059979 TaxID=3347021 RepID=UPI0036A42497